MCKTDCKTGDLGTPTHASRWGYEDTFECTDDCWTLSGNTHYNDYEDASVTNDLCVEPLNCHLSESNTAVRYMFSDKTG